MPLTVAVFLVFALMTSVLVFVGTFCGVQPNRRLPFGPTVAPFGPQFCNFTTPVFVVGSNAPSTAFGDETWVASTTSNPPWQKVGPPKVQPGGLLAICGIDT